MDKDYTEEIKKLSLKIKKINKKFLLLNLIRKAKFEFDNYNFDGCIENCEKIISEDSTNALALRGLGCSMQNLNDYKKAEYYYNKALKYSNNKEIELTLLGNLFYKLQDLDKALEYYNSAIEINDKYDNAYDGRNQAMLENHLKILDIQDDLIKRELN